MSCMGKPLFFTTIIWMTLSACEEKPKNIFERIAAANEKHESVYFKATRNYHYSNQPDTITTPYEVWIVRDPGDTLRGGFVWVDDHYRPYNIIYERGTMYLSIPPKKTTVKYSRYDKAFISQIDWIDVFLDPAKFEKWATDSSGIHTVSDTVYNGTPCYVLTVKRQDGKYTWLLGKNDLMPLLATATQDKGEYVFYEEMTFSGYEFDKIKKAGLEKRKKATLNAIPVKDPYAGFKQFMKEGDPAPDFEGEFFEDGKAFALSDYLGKNIIILDFWYMHCPPCVRAMPLLSELYDEHKDKGLRLLGLNSVDNKPGKMDRLKKFVAKRQISYDIVLTKPEVDRMYKVMGYPTMYLIDKEGKIAKVEVGFSEKNFEEFKARVEEMLKD